MARERGNSLNRILDAVIGVPLMPFAALWRRLRRKQPTPIKRVAVLAMGAIGDTVLLSGLVNAIHKKDSTIEISLYTTKGNAEAAELLSNVSGRYAYPLKKLCTMIGHMRKQRYDLLIDTTQWARIGALISALCNASITVGFRTAGQYRSMPYDIFVEHSAHRHEWKNFLALGQVVFPGIHARPALKAPAAVEVQMPPKPFIVCHMWATGSNSKERQWTNQKWATLIDTLINKGFNILLSGSGEDNEVQEGLKRFYTDKGNEDKIFIGAGKYTLKEYAAVLAQAAAMVSVNTGPMHIASLLGVPTVGIHGPTSPERWGPAGRKSLAVEPLGAHSYLNLGFEKVADDSFSYRVGVDQVLEALKELGVL